jgi:hypothetical protein
MFGLLKDFILIHFIHFFQNYTYLNFNQIQRLEAEFHKICMEQHIKASHKPIYKSKFLENMVGLISIICS